MPETLDLTEKKHDGRKQEGIFHSSDCSYVYFGGVPEIFQLTIAVDVPDIAAFVEAVFWLASDASTIARSEWGT